MTKNTIPVTSITITRVEGPTKLCNQPQTFEAKCEFKPYLFAQNTCVNCGYKLATHQPWAMAAEWLQAQRYTFPARAAHKHDFVVTWANGSTYRGTIDCQRGYDLDLAKRVRDHLLFVSCAQVPAGQEQDPGYARIVAARDEAKKFIDGGYQIGATVNA